MKNIDLKSLPKSELDRIKILPDKTNTLGIGGDKMAEPIPSFLRLESETIFEGENNTLIVLGRDRPSNRLSGYGGKGHTRCGAIDIVVGRMSYLSKETNAANERLFADPNIRFDAARITVSQKTDIDNNFGIAEGSVGISKGQSAIGIKADQIRIIGRQGVKIVSGTDKRNSRGEKIDSVGGIDLIAGNDSSDLQPIPKGENLNKALRQLTDHVQKLASIVDTLLTWQMKMNQTLITHTHISPFYGLNTAPSLQLLSEGPNVMMNHMQGTKMSIMSIKQNLSSFKHNYLAQSGKKYINSRHNNTN